MRGVVAQLWRGLVGLRLIHGPLYKSQLLLTIPFFLALAFPAGDAAFGLLWLLFVQLFLLLCLAYVVNDLADRKADRLTGKERTLSRLSVVAGGAIAGALVGANIAVASVLQAPALYWALLVFGLALAYAYSAPPFSLKRRGLLGIIGGPVLGKTVPLLLCCALWQRWGWWVLVLGAADFLKNAIDLVFHQVVDHDADRQADIRSFVVEIGLSRARALLRVLGVLGAIASLASLAVYALYVPECRWPALLCIALTPVAVLLLRRLSARSATPSPRTLLPQIYVVLGGAIFLLGPAVLGAVLLWRESAIWPLFALVLVVTAGQLRFYWRYQYS